ncbi:MAG: DUF4157 domain-containing protein [Myxococcales bacterium]|nr:DUF4157 domain-containing protein [Myxococcales bacterium]
MARSSPGQSITDRLMSRADGGGLSRRRMADGGEVFTGSVARKALRTLGARAFTVDKQIVVDPTFDASNANDAALYAHERHHQMNSGGEGGGAAGHNDHEESSARQIESMVLHRMNAGEDMASILHDVTTGTAATNATSDLFNKEAGNTMVGRAIQGGDKDTSPMEAYWHARSKGQTHMSIMADLTDFTAYKCKELNEDYNYRSGGERDFMGAPMVRGSGNIS